MTLERRQRILGSSQVDFEAESVMEDRSVLLVSEEGSITIGQEKSWSWTTDRVRGQWVLFLTCRLKGNAKQAVENIAKNCRVFLLLDPCSIFARFASSLPHFSFTSNIF